jgi:hypothetical protein
MHASAIPHAPEALSKISSFLGQLQRDIHLRDVRTGLWFTKVLTAYVELYETNRQRVSLFTLSAAERDAVAQKLTQRAALITALAGAGAAGGVTAASIATAETSGLAAPLVLPLAGAGMVGELLLRSIMHLKLACELADLYGVPFVPGGETELIRLYALAVHAEMHQTENDPGRGLIERVLHLQEAGGLGKLIASGLVGETLLRNAVPFADVVVSSFRNWQLTRQVGTFVQGYVSRRKPLDAAIDAVRERSPESIDLVLEGVWFIFIGDGRLTGIETALLAHLMRKQRSRDELTTHFVSDEAGWLERLREMDPDLETRKLVLHALQVAALIEAPIAAAELAILHHASTALGLTLAEPSHASEPVGNHGPRAASSV